MNGIIVVDKPAGWTSHDVVNKVRRLAGTRKVGHLGTLDPLATGVLPLLINRATRLAQFFRSNDKVYEATIRFGFSTDSYDVQGQPTSPQVSVGLQRDAIEELLTEFRGRIQQVPPPISAKKIAGVPAYKLARKNMEVNLKPVDVEIRELELLACEGNEAEIRVHCTGGTYVRSIAHDLGVRMGCGAHLLNLRRTASGHFQIGMARKLEELQALSSEHRLEEAIIRGAELLPEFPAERVDAITAGQIRQGRDFRISPFRAGAGAPYVKAVGSDGDLIAIGEARLPHVYHPILVL